MKEAREPSDVVLDVWPSGPWPDHPSSDDTPLLPPAIDDSVQSEDIVRRRRRAAAQRLGARFAAQAREQRFADRDRTH